MGDEVRNRGYQTVKTFDNITLAANQYQALGELRHRLFDEFDIEALILYGSVARCEADEESDLDLLIVTAHPLTRPARHEITDMVFEVNLLYGTNFSTLVVDRGSWEVGVFSVLPLREEILKDGIRL